MPNLLQGLDGFLSETNPDILKEEEEKKKKSKFADSLDNFLLNQNRGLPEPHGPIQEVFDFISRPLYGVTKTADVIREGSLPEDRVQTAFREGGVKGVLKQQLSEQAYALGLAFKAVKAGIKEVISPTDRLLFRDVIKATYPVWAANHPKEVEGLGFIGDLALDPLNFVSIGTGTALKESASVIAKSGRVVPLSKVGGKVFQEVIDTYSGIGKTGVDLRLSSERVIQEIIDPTDISKLPVIEKIPNETNLVQSRISRMTDAGDIGYDSAVFVTSFDDIKKIQQGRGIKEGVNPVLSQDKIRNLRNSKNGGKILDDIIKNSSTIEVTPVTAAPFVNKYTNLTTKGSGKLSVGVVVPSRYVTKITKLGDKIGDSKAWVSSTIDFDDLRFVTPETLTPVNFTELGNIINRRINEATKLKGDITFAQSVGQKVLANRPVETLIDKGGLKFLDTTLINSEPFKNMAKSLRLPQAFKAVKELPGFRELGTIAKGASETFGLNRLLEKHYPEWVRHRRHIESRQLGALHNLERSYVSMFSVPDKSGKSRILNKTERSEVTEFFSSVTKEIKDRLQTLGIKNPSEEFGRKVFQDVFSASNLTKEQKGVVIKLQQTYNDFARLEFETELLKQHFVNYHPMRYERINTAQRYVELRRYQSGEPIKTPNTFEKSRRFDTPEDALEAGYQPIMDAGQLYAMRFIEHNAALRRAEWESFIKHNYKGKVPKLIDQDLVRLGEKYYERGFGDASKLAAEVWFSFQNLFRKSATIARVPTFAGKQLIGNFSQIVAELGIDAMRVFDPTIMGDAFSVLTTKGQAKFGFTDIWGIKYTPQDITKILESYPVRKNVAIEGIGYTGEGHFLRKLTSDLYTASHSGKIDSATNGMKNLFVQGARVLQLPAYVEDMARVSTFLSALKAGHNPAAAMEIVDRALFNYTTGLSRIEQAIRKTIIPFYSFQKFGSTLLARTLQKPGRIAVGGKAIREFFTVWNKLSGGEELTENERKVRPGHLLAQPHMFEDFENINGETKAIFRTFNSLVFMDVLNVIEVDKEGQFDPKETLIKGALAQMAPFFKITLELARQRQLFTDRPFDGSIGDIDYDKFLTNIMTQMGMQTGATTAGIGLVSAQAIKANEEARETVKKLIGWEESVDASGNRRVWISPMLLYLSTSLMPSLNGAIRQSRNDMDMKDKILYATFGIGTAKLDLQEQGRFKALEASNEYKDKLKEYRTYLKQGRLTSADHALDDLKEIMEYNENEVNNWLDPNIRGGYTTEE